MTVPLFSFAFTLDRSVEERIRKLLASYVRLNKQMSTIDNRVRQRLLTSQSLLRCLCIAKRIWCHTELPQVVSGQASKG